MRMRTEISNAQSYCESLLTTESASKRKSREAADELGLGRISLSPSEGALLGLLVRLHGCKKFVEIGTLTGLSAQYLIEGMASPEAHLWTLEKSEVHAEKARQAWSDEPWSRQISVVVGDARQTLGELAVEGPFDGLFIDGNKAAYGDYLAWAETNVRKGGLIIADNVFLSGAVWAAEGAETSKFSEKQVRIMRAFNERLADRGLYDGAIVPSAEGLFVALKRF